MTTQQEQSQVIWITGAGTGIGKSLAIKLADEGHKIAASGRNKERLERLAVEHPNITPFAVDVTEEQQVITCVTQISEQLGEVDIAILNAGDYTPMPVEAFDTGLFEKLNRVNYLGVVFCIGALLPAMRQRDSGQILITASVAGYRGLPNSAPYGATKAALINLAETLHIELQQTNLRIRLINPGFVKTPLTDKNDFQMPALLTPEEAAGEILRDLASSNFEITFPKRFTYLLKLFRCLPYRLYFFLIKRVTG